MVRASASKTKPKEAYHHGNLREAVTKEALKQIGTSGSETFTLRGLAKALNVTHGAVYRHFRDKRALLVAIAIAGHQDLRHCLAPMVDQTGPLDDKIAKLAKTYLAWALDNSAQYQIMLGTRLNEDGAYPEMEDEISTSLATLDRLFEKTASSTEEQREQAIALMTQLHGYCDLLLLRRIRAKDRKAAESYLLKVMAPYITGIRARTAQD